MFKILNEDFFNRFTVKVAEELLGKYLVTKYRGKELSAQINEVEVYDGFKDKASHASRGKTLRNTPMFGPAGRWYVYFVYGNHWMLNIVTGPRGYPAAILIRGAGEWCGPGKLTKALHIDKRFNNLPACRRTGLWIEDRGVRVTRRDIKRTARIGVAYAGPLWSRRRWRFVLIPPRVSGAIL